MEAAAKQGSDRALAKIKLMRLKARAAKQEALWARYELERLLREQPPRMVLVKARRKLERLQKEASKLALRSKETRIKYQHQVIKGVE